MPLVNSMCIQKHKSTAKTIGNSMLGSHWLWRVASGGMKLQATGCRVNGYKLKVAIKTWDALSCSALQQHLTTKHIVS